MAPRHVCPTCGRPIEWTEAYPFRPFCSERCRLIDLGAWMRGERAIPGEAVSDVAGASGGEDRDSTTGSGGKTN